MVVRDEMSGSYARIKRRGERGHPCLTPRVMSIELVGVSPKKGETLTSVSEQRTNLLNQVGKAALCRTSWIQSWSIESNALAVSRRKT